MNLYYYFFLSLFLFLTGVCGIFFTRKNLIIVLMSIELMLLSVIYNFIIFSYFLNDISGQLYALYIITLAAAESSIGLAILVVYYRLKGFIIVDLINSIKG